MKKKTGNRNAQGWTKKREASELQARIFVR